MGGAARRVGGHGPQGQDRRRHRSCGRDRGRPGAGARRRRRRARSSPSTCATDDIADRRPGRRPGARRRRRRGHGRARRGGRPSPTGRSTCGSPTPASPSAAGHDAPDETWALQWQVNVMSHVYAARALLPGWIARGEGHLVTTASMAGILTSLGDGVYAATKHAAVGFAEWLAITHGDDGVKVSCVCPGGVDTAMLRGGAGGRRGEGGGRDRRRRRAVARRGRGPRRSPPSPRTASSSTPTPSSRCTPSARPPTPSGGSPG